MAEKERRVSKGVGDESDVQVKIPTTLSFRDVLLIMAAIASVVGAWGVYGNRLSVVETNVLTINKEFTEFKQEYKETKQRLRGDIESIKDNDTNIKSKVSDLEHNTETRLKELQHDLDTHELKDRVSPHKK